LLQAGCSKQTANKPGVTSRGWRANYDHLILCAPQASQASRSIVTEIQNYPRPDVLKKEVFQKQESV
jgi:hypothetical protein